MTDSLRKVLFEQLSVVIYLLNSSNLKNQDTLLYYEVKDRVVDLLGILKNKEEK